MQKLLRDNWIPLTIGIAAGVINGFFGGGAGMLLVPVFIRVCGMRAKRACSTSLCVTLALTPVTLAAYLLKDGLPEITLLPFLLGGAAGALVGVFLFRRMPTKLLRYLLAGFMIFSAVRILYE